MAALLTFNPSSHLAEGDEGIELQIDGQIVHRYDDSDEVVWDEIFETLEEADIGTVAVDAWESPGSEGIVQLERDAGALDVEIESGTFNVKLLKKWARRNGLLND